MARPATGNLTSLYIVAEETVNETPENPVWTQVRFTGSLPTLTRDVQQSAELDGSREVTNQRSGNYNPNGEINCELYYGSHDAIIEAALQGTWTSDVLIVGTSIKTFSFLIHYADLNDGAGGYDLITGVEITSMGLGVSVNALVTATFGVIGRDMTANATLPDGSTFEDVGTTKPYHSLDGAIKVDGTTIGFATSLSPNVDNTGEATFVIGSNGPSHISYAKLANTMDLEAFFFDYDLYEQFINDTEFSLTMTLTYEGNAMEIYYPRCKFESAAPNVSGAGDITFSGTIRALKDSTLGASMQITRSAA